MMTNIDMRLDPDIPSRPTEGYIQLLIEHHRHSLSRDHVPSPEVDIGLDEYTSGIDYHFLPSIPVGSLPRISLDSYTPPKCSEVAAQGLLAGVGADGMVSALSRVAGGERVFYHGELGGHDYESLGSVLGREEEGEGERLETLSLIHGVSCIDDAGEV